jgi:hypothetical protein
MSALIRKRNADASAAQYSSASNTPQSVPWESSTPEVLSLDTAEPQPELAQQLDSLRHRISELSVADGTEAHIEDLRRQLADLEGVQADIRHT